MRTSRPSRTATAACTATGACAIQPMIEVGNIFKLGTSYADKLGATYLDEAGHEQPIVMGSYGIGPARVAAAAIEQSHDEPAASGRRRSRRSTPGWSRSATDAAATGDRLDDELRERGLTSMIDDRDQSPGSKFADADLIGVPLRVTLGKRTVSDGTVDVRVRATGASESVPLAEAAERIVALRMS